MWSRLVWFVLFEIIIISFEIFLNKYILEQLTSDSKWYEREGFLRYNDQVKHAFELGIFMNNV